MPEEELTVAKKRKEELEQITQKLFHSVDWRAKEAEKKNDMALLI